MKKAYCRSSQVFIWAFLFKICACATNSAIYDPQHPAHAWTGDCYPHTVAGFNSWVFLKCTFTNRTTQALLFPRTQVVRSDQDIWRQPDASELKQLKHDLQTRKNALDIPIFIGNGNGRWESFLGQALVLSGVWILKANSKTENFETPDKEIKVDAGNTVEQVYVLHRELLVQPRFVVFRDKSGLFEKSVNIGKNPNEIRQRPIVTESP